MTDEEKVVSDNEQLASGTTEKNQVAYETHQRLLAQRKKDQERLNQLESEYKTMLEQKRLEEEGKLSQKGEYQKIIELREQKIKDLEDQVNSVNLKYKEAEERINTARKISVFESKLPAKVVNRDFLKLVDFDEIAIDPATNEIDIDSVDKLVSAFVKKYPVVLDTRKTNMPNEATTSGSSRIDYDAWLKLPLVEQKKYKFTDLKNIPK